MTIHIEASEASNVVKVQASGKLNKEDYEKFVPEIEKLIDEHGKLRILFEMKDFHGWDRGALWEDIKFDRKHHADIERLGLVGDKKWEQWMATICRPFTSAKIEYFDESKRSEAESWIAS